MRRVEFIRLDIMYPDCRREISYLSKTIDFVPFSLARFVFKSRTELIHCRLHQHTLVSGCDGLPS